MTPTMTAPTAPSKNKIRVKLITIHRAEGLPEECITTMHETWVDAEKRIQAICSTAPKDGCYDKTDFTLVYSDCETYSGRIDCAHPTSKAYDGTLADHVRHHLLFCSGLKRPDHIDEATYEGYLADHEKRTPGFKQNALAFLKHYALEDLPPDPQAQPAQRNDMQTATAPVTHQKTASEAHAENVAYAKANNLPMVTVVGNTFPIRGVLYAFGGKWDGKAKQWSVPSHKHAEAQAAADKFTKPVKTPTANYSAPVSTPQPTAITTIATPAPTATTAAPKPIAPPVAQQPAKAKAKGTTLSPLQKRLTALLTGAKAIHDSVPPGDAIRPQLAFTINHIQEALDRLG